MDKTEWTEHDTKVCEEGWKSGKAIDRETGKPITLEKLNYLISVFAREGCIKDIDEFADKHMTSVPFD